MSLVSVVVLEIVTYRFKAIKMDNYLRLLLLGVKKLEGNRIIKDSLRIPRVSSPLITLIDPLRMSIIRIPRDEG